MDSLSFIAHFARTSFTGKRKSPEMPTDFIAGEEEKPRRSRKRHNTSAAEDEDGPPSQREGSKGSNVGLPPASSDSRLRSTGARVQQLLTPLKDLALAIFSVPGDMKTPASPLSSLSSSSLCTSSAPFAAIQPVTSTTCLGAHSAPSSPSPSASPSPSSPPDTDSIYIDLTADDDDDDKSCSRQHALDDSGGNDDGEGIAGDAESRDTGGEEEGGERELVRTEEEERRLQEDADREWREGPLAAAITPAALIRDIMLERADTAAAVTPPARPHSVTTRDAVAAAAASSSFSATRPRPPSLLFEERREEEMRAFLPHRRQYHQQQQQHEADLWGGRGRLTPASPRGRHSFSFSTSSPFSLSSSLRSDFTSTTPVLDSFAEEASLRPPPPHHYHRKEEEEEETDEESFRELVSRTGTLTVDPFRDLRASYAKYESRKRVHDYNYADRAKEIGRSQGRLAEAKTSYEQAFIELRAEEKRRRLEKARVKWLGEDRRPFSPEEQALISRALRGRASEVLVSGFNTELSRQDMQRLRDAEWLNDEVINFYLNLLKQRSDDRKTPEWPKCHFLNTFFYPLLADKGGYNYSRVQKWTRRVKLFEMDRVIVPIHLGNHWCLAVINLQHKRFEYYDSLGSSNKECLQRLRRYLQDEARDKKGEALDLSEWEDYQPKDIPMQKNGYDCGVFACKFAECVSSARPFYFSQVDMPLYRKRMIVSILCKSLT